MPFPLLETAKAQSLKAIYSNKGCVGILGRGISGRAVAALCEALGLAYTVFDEKTGPDLRPQDISLIDLFVYSPGFRQDHPWLERIRKHPKPCLGEWNLGASLWQGPFIAITGTNGKTTLTELLTQAFQAAKVSALAVGNNTYPICQALADGLSQGFSPQATAVCELSSFQAEQIDKLQADALLWTNISEDHLDRYGTLEAYFKAKWQLTHTLKPGALFFTEQAIIEKAKAYSLSIPATTQVVEEPKDAHGSSVPPAFSNLGQRKNYELARAFWKTTGHGMDALYTAAQAFKPLKHRLQKIATLQGVSYWNDSKGTNFAATLMALKTFDKPVYWIGGGQPKGGDIEQFCASIVPYIEKAFLIGETAPLLQTILERHHKPATTYPSLEKLVVALHPTVPAGQHVLLSPGFASLDQFKSYAERGEVFEKTVLGLKARYSDDS